MLTTFCEMDPSRGSQDLCVGHETVGDSVTRLTRRMDALLFTTLEILRRRRRFSSYYTNCLTYYTNSTLSIAINDLRITKINYLY